MALQVVHPFQSAKADGVDTTLVQPSNWNADHTITMATGKLLGRGTAATGAVEEISLGAALAFSGTALQTAAMTGDVTTAANSFATTIANDAITTAKVLDANITYAKIQNISATKRVLGRNSALAGVTEEVTATQLLDWVGSPAAGDILYRGASAWAFLPKGTDTHVLTLASGLPSWAAPTAGIEGMTVQVFTTPGANTWTKPAGVKFVRVICVGGGGGGGSSDSGNSNSCGGGGGGGYTEKTIDVQAITSETATVGALGAGGSAGGNGSSGGTSSFGAHCSATGGAGGVGGAAGSGAGGAGGSGSSGDVNISGQGGFNGGGTYLAPGTGGAPAYGFGFGGKPVAAGAAGGAGAGYGAGGSGCVGNGVGTAAGGAGTAGIIIVFEYK